MRRAHIPVRRAHIPVCQAHIPVRPVDNPVLVDNPEELAPVQPVQELPVQELQLEGLPVLQSPVQRTQQVEQPLEVEQQVLLVQWSQQVLVLLVPTLELRVPQELRKEQALQQQVLLQQALLVRVLQPEPGQCHLFERPMAWLCSGQKRKVTMREKKNKQKCK